MHQDPKQLEIAEKLLLMCRDFLLPTHPPPSPPLPLCPSHPAPGVSSQQANAVTAPHFSSHCLLPTAHYASGKGCTTIGHTVFAAHVSRWEVSPWDLQNLQCLEILLLSFFLSLHIPFLFCSLILTMHSNTQRSSGHWRQGQCMKTRICIHLAGEPCFKLQSKTSTVGDHSSGTYERELGNQWTIFSCFIRKKRCQFTTRDKVL